MKRVKPMIKPLGCAILGHSPMRFSWGFDEKYPKCLQLKRVLRKQILCCLDQGVAGFHTICDCGVGLYAAEIVAGIAKNNTSVRLICTIPYENQSVKWTPDLRKRYYKVLQECSDCHTVSVKKTSDCTDRAYSHIILSSDRVLAVYDPLSFRWDSVDIAMKLAVDRGMPLELIHPDTLALSRPKPEQITFCKPFTDFDELLQIQ